MTVPRAALGTRLDPGENERKRPMYIMQERTSDLAVNPHVYSRHGLLRIFVLRLTAALLQLVGASEVSNLKHHKESPQWAMAIIRPRQLVRDGVGEGASEPCDMTSPSHSPMVGRYKQWSLEGTRRCPRGRGFGKCKDRR